MKRPNRYPYMKNQWKEEMTMHYTGYNECLKIVSTSNRITGEINAYPTKV